MSFRFAPVILRNATKTMRCTPVRNFGWRSRLDDTLPVVFRQMNRHVQEMERDMMDLMQNSRVWRIPAWDVFKRQKLPLNYDVTQVDGVRKMRWQLDLSDYKPEEIKVTVKNKELTIHAKQEKTDGKGGKSVQEYYRQISLPDDANLDSIKSLFNEDGMLRVEIELPAITSGTEIPVEKIN